MAVLFPNDINAVNILSAAEQSKRDLEREELRERRRQEGMSEAEIEALEKEEDRKFEAEQKRKSQANIFTNLEVSFI